MLKNFTSGLLILKLENLPLVPSPSNSVPLQDRCCTYNVEHAFNIVHLLHVTLPQNLKIKTPLDLTFSSFNWL